MVLLKLAFDQQKYWALKLSTFHYGSIKIEEMENKFNVVFESTFHYGSIKILNLQLDCFRGDNNLHSTMVLLK